MLFFEYFYGLLRVFKVGWKETNLRNIRIDIHFSRLMVLCKQTSVRKIWMLARLVSTHPLRWLPKSSVRQAKFGVFVIDVFQLSDVEVDRRRKDGARQRCDHHVGGQCYKTFGR
jgi:hypothetical protein